MKFEVWPSSGLAGDGRWFRRPTVEVMNRSYPLPRTWFVNARIYFDWNPSSTEVFV